MPKNKTVVGADFYKNPITISISDLTWRPAAYGIVIKDNKILLSQQTNGYDLPGGGIDLGEAPEEAVIREVKEETGITVNNPRLIDAGTAYFNSISTEGVYYQAIALYYLCDYVSGELTDAGLEEFERTFTKGPVWLDLTELDTIQVGGYRDFKEIVKKAIQDENNRH